VTVSSIAQRDGRSVLDFEDFEGQRLTLVADRGPKEAVVWDRSSVPAEHQIIGLGPITISVPELKATERVLTGIMNMKKTREYALEGAPVQVFEMGPAGPGAELHVAAEPAASPGRQGAGGVHHVAFRVPDDKAYEEWQKRLADHGMPSSGPVDRYYFRSLYFREPGGVLFELATDGPGFAVDEPKETLGEKLALPPFLEAQRKQIEAGLKPLNP
jgi:glyoxalase family protein